MYNISFISTQDKYMAEKNKPTTKNKPSKPSKTYWIILFFWIEPACQISASYGRLSCISSQDSMCGWENPNQPTQFNNQTNLSIQNHLDHSIFESWAVMPNLYFQKYKWWKKKKNQQF